MLRAGGHQGTWQGIKRRRGDSRAIAGQVKMGIDAPAKAFLEEIFGAGVRGLTNDSGK
jgi:hypothetical protein